MAKRSKKAILISIGLLLILVVIFPLISLKYLNKGLDFRRDQLATLESLGQVVDFSAINLDGKTVTKDNTLGNVVVVSHEQLACDPQLALTLKEYVSKFENQDVFRHVILKDRSTCDSWLETYKADRSSNEELFKQFDSIIATDDRKNEIIIVDRQGQIR